MIGYLLRKDGKRVRLKPEDMGYPRIWLNGSMFEADAQIVDGVVIYREVPTIIPPSTTLWMRIKSKVLAWLK